MFGFIKKNRANSMLEKSVRLYDKCEFDSALKLIGDLLKMFPRCEKALYIKGKIYRILGDIDESLSCYDNIIHINPEYIYSWIEKALIFLTLKKYDKALKVLDEGLSININNQKLMEIKIRIFKESGKYSEGLEYANYILNNINEELGIELKGSMLLAMGNYNEAYNCFYKLYGMNQENIGACYGLSSTFYYLENLDNAIEFMKKCIELDNENLMFRLLYVSYLIENKSYDHALSIINESLKLYNDFKLYYFKGVCLEFLNKEKKEAEKYYEKGLKLGLDKLNLYYDEDSSVMIGVILESLNRPDEAKKYFDRLKN